MADETPNPNDTEQGDTNPATETQSPANVVTVYDSDGREHFAAPTSKWVVDGLSNGSLTEQPAAEEQSTEEVPSGAETGSTGDDPEPGGADGRDGSEDGTPDTSGTGRRRRAGQA